MKIKEKANTPNPIPLFSIGFIYYLITPYLVYFFLLELLPILEENLGLDPNRFLLLKDALIYFKNDNFFNFYYILDILTIFVSFLIGINLTKRIVISDSNSFDNLNDFEIGYILVTILSSILTVFLLVLMHIEDVAFFSGYKEFNVVYLGALSVLFFVNLFFYLIYSPIRNVGILKILLVILGVVLLGLGSRNIVLCGFITLLFAYVQNAKSHITNIQISLIVLLIVIVLVFVGIWRTGYEFSTTMIINHFFTDSFFVSSSAACYLDGAGGRPLINYPYSILAGFVNFAPSILFPQKFIIINEIISNSFYCSPYGGSSILMTLYANFGMLYPIYVVALGGFFGFLYTRASNSFFFRCVYLINCPFIIFHIFNQPIYSQMKLILFNGFILPISIMFFISLLKNILRKSDI